jgi:O-antigen/teichoic acid export membrane protein
VFGETWRTAGEITRLLVPLYLTRLVVTPVSQTLNAYGRQSQHLLTATLDTSLLATSFVIAWQFSLEPLTTVLMFSVGSSLAYLLYFWLAFNAARSLARLAVEVEAQQREPAIDALP